jgi:succinate dehydrogenase hydrophobic membrane anchor protein
MDLCKRNGIKSSVSNLICYFIYQFNYDRHLFLEYIFMKGSTKWYWQRVSAFILVPTSYWFVFFFVNNLEASHSLMLNSLNNFFIKFFMILFFFVATFHARLGLVTIYQDYFHEDKVRLYSRLTDILLLLVILFILPIILI